MFQEFFQLIEAELIHSRLFNNVPKYKNITLIPEQVPKITQPSVLEKLMYICTCNTKIRVIYCPYKNALFFYEVKGMRIINEKILSNILDYISSFQKERGMSPSFRSIQSHIGATSLSIVHRYIRELKFRNLLSSENTGSIAIDPRLASKRTVSVPLIGYVPCGTPILALENIEASYPMPSELFGMPDLFMLIAKGHSMIGAGIRDSDILVIKKQNFASPRDIVVALIGEDATVKRYLPSNNQIILHPENPAMEDIIVPDCQIIGVVVSYIHKF